MSVEWLFFLGNWFLSGKSSLRFFWLLHVLRPFLASGCPTAFLNTPQTRLVGAWLYIDNYHGLSHRIAGVGVHQISSIEPLALSPTVASSYATIGSGLLGILRVRRLTVPSRLAISPRWRCGLESRLVVSFAWSVWRRIWSASGSGITLPLSGDSTLGDLSERSPPIDYPALRLTLPPAATSDDNLGTMMKSFSRRDHRAEWDPLTFLGCIHDCKTGQETLKIEPQMTLRGCLTPSMFCPIHAADH